MNNADPGPRHDLGGIAPSCISWRENICLQGRQYGIRLFNFPTRQTAQKNRTLNETLNQKEEPRTAGGEVQTLADPNFPRKRIKKMAWRSSRVCSPRSTGPAMPRM